MQSPEQLRQEARVYAEAAKKEGALDLKRRFAGHAFEVVQRAEKMERDERKKIGRRKTAT